MEDVCLKNVLLLKRGNDMELMLFVIGLSIILVGKGIHSDLEDILAELKKLNNKNK